ncbi:MAG: hypothetical protein FWF83_08890 [Clostridiales bacterium]|nr:hypothetical protein [Clostridiales bacterium]
MFIKKKGFSLLRTLIPLALTAVVVFAVSVGASKTQEQAAAQARRLTEESIRRAAVQCYALEGIYPVNIEYLMDHYGIRPDTNRFIIHYQFVADNLLPDISVIPIVK